MHPDPVRYSVYQLALAGVLACLTVMANAADPGTPANAVDSRTPIEIVEQTASAVATRVANDRERLEAHTDELYAVVDQIFLPVFDTRYAGRLILGRHARSATAEQRQQFVDAFYNFLVHSYASNMLKFKKDSIKVYPASSGSQRNSKRSVVRTQLSLDDGSTVSVDYRLRQTAEGWRIYDVIIDGISYVQTYRSQFDAEISARGLDATITRLQSKITTSQDASPAGSSAP